MMMDALLYLLGANLGAALTLPSQPQIITPGSLPLAVNHSSNQPVDLNPTARPEIWNGIGGEEWRERLLPGVEGMPSLYSPPACTFYLAPLKP